MLWLLPAPSLEAPLCDPVGFGTESQSRGKWVEFLAYPHHHPHIHRMVLWKPNTFENLFILVDIGSIPVELLIKARA